MGAPLLRRRGGGVQAHEVDVFLYVPDDPRGDVLFGLADRVLDGVGVGGAVGLDDGLGDAQQRGAPYLTGIQVHIIEADIHKGAHHNILSCNIYDISFYGHQFIENIRPESVWEKTKGIATSIGNHSLKFIEDTAQKCAVTATATMVSSLSNVINN